jgi:hypothetical protein
VKNPDGFIEEPVRLPKCKHVFGDRCLKQWLQDSDSCPYCRDKLPSEPKRNLARDESRRVIANHRFSGLDPWHGYEALRMHTEAANFMSPRDHQNYQQLLQQRLRREDGRDLAATDELMARYVFRQGGHGHR